MFVEKVLFRNSTNGYTVLCCSTDSAIPLDVSKSKFPHRLDNPFTCIYTDVSGFMDTFNKKLKYKVLGEWRTTKYGKQFEISKIEVSVGNKKDDVLSFLVTLDGVGPKVADKIYSSFKSKTMDIVENNPQKLIEVKGISKKKLEKIIDSIEESRKYKRILDFFSNFSISQRKIKKIFDSFEDKAIEVVNENPFMLCQVEGIGFLDANSIAIDSGVGLDSPQRISLCLSHVLKSLTERTGDLFISLEEVIKKATDLLNKGSNITIDEETVRRGLISLQLEGSVKLIKADSGTEYIYPLAYFICENEVANRLIDMAHNTKVKKLPEKTILEDITQLEEKFKFKLADKQKSAVITGINNNIAVITGGPGTGKSTILKFILEIFKKRFSNNILLCAPTGRAARRMAEITGFLSASTIHSALGINNDYSWAQTADSIEPIDVDLVVIDESSMIDMELMYILINSIDYKTKIIFLGDSEQLPSVGPGNCLREMIKSSLLPTVTLDVIFRQKGESKIVINANKLNKGNFDFEYDDTFVFHKESSAEQVKTVLVNLFLNELKKPNRSLDNIVILSPFKTNKVPCSTYELNIEIQKNVNPISPLKASIKVGRYTFLKGDKVIQQKNNDFAKNGDVGYIKSIEFDGSESFATIDFTDGETVKYSRADMEEYSIALAYAITVHKSQGTGATRS